MGWTGASWNDRAAGWNGSHPEYQLLASFFWAPHWLFSVVGAGFDWGGLPVSSSIFANSPQSLFVAFIDNSNVLIIGDSFTECESSRKEHIALQNVPLTPTCTHPPTHLFSFHLNYFPLVSQYCHFSFVFAREPGLVGWQSKSSRWKHHIQLPKTSPMWECQETIRQLRETWWNSRVPRTSVSRLVLKDKPETFYSKNFRHANKKPTCPLHSADTLIQATISCRISINVLLLQRSFQLLQILAKSVSEFLNSFTNVPTAKYLFGKQIATVEKEINKVKKVF